MSTWKCKCCGKPMTRGQVGLFGVIMKPKRYVEGKGVLIESGKPIIFSLDGQQPRDLIDGEHGWKDLYNTDQATAFNVSKGLRREQ